MGENLAMNIERNGYPIAVWNREPHKVDDFVARSEGRQVIGAHGCVNLRQHTRGIGAAEAGRIFPGRTTGATRLRSAIRRSAPAAQPGTRGR
jgi:hypothetical protein